MKCLDLQLNLWLYADGFLTEAESEAVAGHLEVCPLCRQAASEIRDVRAGLRRMGRPELSLQHRNSLKDTVRTELRKERESWLRVSPDFRELLQMRIMPFSVGVFASVIVGFTFLTMMFSGLLRTNPDGGTTATGYDGSVMLANNSNPFVSETSVYISPSDFAQTRRGYGTESPSINPQGSLIALTKSLVHGGMKDDEVVVVADVYGNGLADIAEVVEPSRDSRAVVALRKALRSDTDYAAFVPANLESRPESVRVVLKFQTVNVRTGMSPLRASKRKLSL